MGLSPRAYIRRLFGDADLEYVGKLAFDKCAQITAVGYQAAGLGLQLLKQPPVMAAGYVLQHIGFARVGLDYGYSAVDAGHEVRVHEGTLWRAEFMELMGRIGPLKRAFRPRVWVKLQDRCCLHFSRAPAIAADQVKSASSTMR